MPGSGTNSTVGSTGSAESGDANSARSGDSGPGDQNNQTGAVGRHTPDAGGQVLVSVLKEARLEPAHGGAILYATALARHQGYYNARLYSETGTTPDEDGVLKLEFRAQAPGGQTPISTERSRLITAGLFISGQNLAAARNIVVIGRRNQIVLRQ